MLCRMCLPSSRTLRITAACFPCESVCKHGLRLTPQQGGHHGWHQHPLCRGMIARSAVVHTACLCCERTSIPVRNSPPADGLTLLRVIQLWVQHHLHGAVNLTAVSLCQGPPCSADRLVSSSGWKRQCERPTRREVRDRAAPRSPPVVRAAVASRVLGWRQQCAAALELPVAKPLWLPPQQQGLFQWWEPFVSLLTQRVRLVGSTISCEAAPLDGDPASKVWRRNPHVQSFALATDQVRGQGRCV